MILLNSKRFSLVFYLLIPLTYKKENNKTDFYHRHLHCIKTLILFVLQQDVGAYANTIHGVRLQMDVGGRLAKKIFQCVAALF